MSEFNNALQEIIKILARGDKTEASNWTAIMDELVGSNDAETINNVYGFVKENFSFKIADGAEGYVYYGVLNDETRIWEVVDGVVQSSEGSYGYISSTEAGMLFNDEGFLKSLSDHLYDFNVTNKNFYNNAFNGTNSSGVIELSDGTTVQAFNDFFSVNYINNLECSNVSTLLSGDYTINCFGRTEFQAILDNAAIKTINGIDKNVFYELYHAAPAGEEMTYIVDALKASEVSSLENIYYRIGAEGVEIVSKETEGAASLIDTLISGEKITSSSTKTIDEILSLYGDALSAESRTALQALAKNSESALFEILSRDSEAILSLAGKDSMQIGKFTITKGGQITEILADGTKVYTEATEITNAERAAAEGYTAVEGTGETIFTKFKNGLIKVLDVALGIVLV